MQRRESTAALFNLIPVVGDKVYERIHESGAIQKAFEWTLDKLKELGITWDYFAEIIHNALHSIQWGDIADPEDSDRAHQGDVPAGLRQGRRLRLRSRRQGP